MDDPEPETFWTKEPNDDWLRKETVGSKPVYFTPFPRLVMNGRQKVKDWIEKEKRAGKEVNVTPDDFIFKRRHGLKERQDPVVVYTTTDTREESVVDESTNIGIRRENRDAVELLTRDPKIMIDHRRRLHETCKALDSTLESSRTINSIGDEAVKNIKEKISKVANLNDLMACLHDEGNSEIVTALSNSFSDVCQAEISRINPRKCPLTEFPCSMNENIYSEIVEYGIEQCPQLMQFVTNTVVRKDEPVLCSDIIKIGTLFSSICYLSNRNLNSLVKTRSIVLQSEGLTNSGLNLLAATGLGQTARSLSNHRDLFCDIGRRVMENTAAGYPYRSELDNADFDREHLTVEVIQKESIDTSNLSTEKMTKEEALKLFRFDKFTYLSL